MLRKATRIILISLESWKTFWLFDASAPEFVAPSSSSRSVKLTVAMKSSSTQLNLAANLSRTHKIRPLELRSDPTYKFIEEAMSLNFDYFSMLIRYMTFFRNFATNHGILKE
jgi:hypothetical protein